MSTPRSAQHEGSEKRAVLACFSCRLTRWALRCTSCFFVTKEAGRVFCPKCGNMTLDKVGGRDVMMHMMQDVEHVSGVRKADMLSAMYIPRRHICQMHEGRGSLLLGHTLGSSQAAFFLLGVCSLAHACWATVGALAPYLRASCWASNRGLE